MRKTTIKVSQPEIYNDWNYVDADIYVTHGSDEWRFTVSLDKETGEIYDGDITFAASPEDHFDPPTKDELSKLTVDVQAAFQQMRPIAVAMLKTRQQVTTKNTRL
jgi:hypothetical protein